jgi:hypothetical protein
MSPDPSQDPNIGVQTIDNDVEENISDISQKSTIEA